jgi:hypothetical protein
MSIVKNHIAQLDGSAAAYTDRLIIGTLIGVANVAGSGAGASVSTVVTFAEPLPASFGVSLGMHQDAVGYITTITTFGFTVVLNPRLASNTLAAGTFDVKIFA